MAIGTDCCARTKFSALVACLLFLLSKDAQMLFYGDRPRFLATVFRSSETCRNNDSFFVTFEFMKMGLAVGSARKLGGFLWRKYNLDISLVRKLLITRDSNCNILETLNTVWLNLYWKRNQQSNSTNYIFVLHKTWSESHFCTTLVYKLV